MSSVKAAKLYLQFAFVMSLIFSFALKHKRRGSSVSMNTSGDRGHPCLVPLWMEKAFDRKALTQTLAVGAA